MGQFFVSVEEDKSLTQKLLSLEYVAMARGHCFFCKESISVLAALTQFLHYV